MTHDEPFAGILVSTANEKTARERTDVSGLAGILASTANETTVRERTDVSGLAGTASHRVTWGPTA